MPRDKMFPGPTPPPDGRTPHERFTAVLRAVLSVSKEELERREQAWRAAGGGHQPPPVKRRATR